VAKNEQIPKFREDERFWRTKVSPGADKSITAIRVPLKPQIQGFLAKKRTKVSPLSLRLKP